MHIYVFNDSLSTRACFLILLHTTNPPTCVAPQVMVMRNNRYIGKGI